MYGTVNGDKMGRVTNSVAVSNVRPLLAFIYNF